MLHERRRGAGDRLARIPRRGTKEWPDAEAESVEGRRNGPRPRTHWRAQWPSMPFAFPRPERAGGQKGETAGGAPPGLVGARVSVRRARPHLERSADEETRSRHGGLAGSGARASPNGLGRGNGPVGLAPSGKGGSPASPAVSEGPCPGRGFRCAVSIVAAPSYAGVRNIVRSRAVPAAPHQP